MIRKFYDAEATKSGGGKDEKYYLIKLNDNFADEFDIESFKVMDEKEYEEAMKITKKALKSIFKIPSEPFTKEEFKTISGYGRYIRFEGKYQELTYEKYLTDPAKFNEIIDRKAHEIYFGTNESLTFNNEKDYWRAVKIKVITKEQRDVIVKLLGDSYGTCTNFFPIEDYDEDEDDGDDDEYTVPEEKISA